MRKFHALLVAGAVSLLLLGALWFLQSRRGDKVMTDMDDAAEAWAGDAPQEAWSVPVRRGYAGPRIHGGSVLIMDRDGSRRDILRRLSLEDGREIWNYSYSAPGSLDYPGSRSTPATDGQMVYSIGGFGHIKAVTFDRGKLAWEAHLLADWGARRPDWGVAQSPLLLGDLLIVMPWGSRAAVVAYDKRTGRVRWTTPNRSGRALEYQSPVAMQWDGKTQVLCSGRHGYTIGVSAEGGRRLWSYGGRRGRSFYSQWHIPSPVPVPGGNVLLAGGYGAGAALLQLEPEGDGYAVRELWRNRSMGTRLGPVLLHDGYFYANCFDIRAGLRCVDQQGRVQWESERKFQMGSILIAADRLFVVDGSNGDLFMVEATAERYNVLGRAEGVLSGREVWGPMAYDDGRLLLRDHRRLVCLDVNPN